VVRRAGNSNSKSSLKQLTNGDHHGRYGGEGGGTYQGGGGGGNGVLDATCNGGFEG
ncbi:hypothetical protein A2U01_0109818, partial [Trifolium medium]|nr:hypothetical protein [Trifolium medium]